MFILYKMKVHFATFANGKYTKTLERIRQEAVDSGFFTGSIFCFSEKELDPEFYQKHSLFMNSTRGFGYWMWKPQVVLQVFDQIDEGDIVVYADAGCTINKDARDRFDEYIRLVQSSDKGLLSLELADAISALKEKEWCKMDTLCYFNVQTNEQILIRGQYVGGIWVIRKQPSTTELLNTWRECMANNHSLIDDSCSIKPNYQEFREHRNDQAVWSILRKLYGGIVILDETYPRPPKSPIWATRILY